jgi:hypothetical protein
MVGAPGCDNGTFSGVAPRRPPMSTQPVEIPVTLTVPERMAFDLFVTAMEGGIGYWSAALNYHWHVPGVDPGGADADVEDLDGFHAMLCLDPDDEWPDGAPGSTPRRLDGGVICEGIRRIVTGETVVARRIRHALVVGMVDYEQADFDAEVADVVAQAGLLGTLVYC